MPTYDYECQKCDHTFEKFQGINDKHLKKCPECGKLSLLRLIGTGGALLFKGSGFYTTDYRSKDYQAKAKADKEAQSKSTKSESSESKPSSSKDSSAKPEKKSEGS